MATKTPFTPYEVQKALGVPQDGKWGKLTEAAARTYLGTMAEGWDRLRLVIGVQQKMMVAAGIPVEIDGFNGPATKDAFEAYEALLRSQGPTPDTHPAPVPLPDPAPTSQRPPKIIRHQWPKQSGVPDFYGAVGSHQTLVKPPWPMVLAWDTSSKVNKISLHEKVAPSALECMEKALAFYGQSGIEKLGLNLWGGSLNVRKIRGGSGWSMHSWGIALDFDPDRNELRMDHTKARLAKKDAEPWWQIWEEAGWTSLGRSRDFDWMHVQAASL